jgi:hypothetical protein
MQKAVEDGRIKCFDLREGPADLDQDLNLWSRELEDVIREIMEDPVFKGNQIFSFEMDVDTNGKCFIRGKANAGVISKAIFYLMQDMQYYASQDSCLYNAIT